MSSDRREGRSVYFYDVANPGSDALGGLIQNGSVTEENFLDMLSIVLITASPITVTHRASRQVVSRIGSSLPIGTYDISCGSEIRVNNEPWIHRILSHNISGQEDAFRDQVRARDKRCVVSGMVNPIPSRWTYHEAAHIFPLEREDYWREHGYSRWVTNMDDTIGKSTIDSCQNGLLLSKAVLAAFDQYLLSVNPDDNYKVVVFDFDVLGVDGRTLDLACRTPGDPNAVADSILRWHYRQSILANVRGGGEPVFEHDFPPGTDMIGEILQGPYSKERFELEVAARLRGFVGE